MEIKFNITKTDLLKSQIFVLFRNRALIVFFFVMYSVVFLNALFSSPEDFDHPPIYFAISSLIFIVVISFGMGVLFMLLQVLFVKGGQGVLGEHTITLTDEALIEETSVNRGVHNWTGIKRMRFSKSYIIINITDAMAHVIPKRAFENTDEEKRFGAFIKEKISMHK